MEQIYYTQCPIGYGMGASNGFQIKRLTPGYPLSGDYRHFGLRAFLAGTRKMSPPALRYRRAEDGAAEVAWLTPRSHEYETERGLWGRPGGQFAHGVRLGEAELAAIAEWPAGLYNQPCWTRSDPAPSLGMPPDAFEVSAGSLRWPPTFESVAPLASRFAGAAQLAAIFDALARVVRDERTLYLIGRAETLGEQVALLTLAFPEPWRKALSFSTFSDRPDELPGFRLQGTTPDAKPNRAALLGLGIVADLATGTIEPLQTPARWAETLAGWFFEPIGEARAAWDRLRSQSLRARSPESPQSIWDDEWLDRIVLFGTSRVSVPTGTWTPQQWDEQAELAAWSNRAGLGADWAEVRPPGWWREVVDLRDEPRRAFLAHLGVAEAWTGTDPETAWGPLLADRVRLLGADERTATILRAFEVAPHARRPAFAQAIVRALPSPQAQDALAGLKAHPECDRRSLLPLEVLGALAPALERRDTRGLRNLLSAACASPDVLPEVLATIEAEATGRPAARSTSAAALADVLKPSALEATGTFLNWALSRGDVAETWAAPFLHRLFADPSNQEEWRVAALCVAAEHRPAFARLALTVAREPTLPNEAFRWAAEETLLPLDQNQRPHDPAWAGTYLDRLPSGLELVKRLFTREYRRLGIKRWLDRAASVGELLPEHLSRIESCEAYTRALMSGDARSILDVHLPVVPPEERGKLLGQILGHFGSRSAEVLEIALDTCREAWPGAFDAGVPGLTGIGAVLSEVLAAWRNDPLRWFDGLSSILRRLGLDVETGEGFESDGLGGAILAATTRQAPADHASWRLRRFLLGHERAWRMLAPDLWQELADAEPPAAVEAFDRWDRHLAKGLQTGRFFELWLNLTNGRQLAAVVTSRVADLRSLEPLPAWDFTTVDGVPRDVRERFARLAPMAPLSADALPGLREWMRGPRTSRVVRPPSDDGDLVPLDSDEDARVASPPADEPSETQLSGAAAVRWKCIDALSVLYRPGLDAAACWQTATLWARTLSLGALDNTDRYRFLAWVVWRLEIGEPFQVAGLAGWLVESGLTDLDRINRWADELRGLASIPDSARIARMALTGEIRALIKQALAVSRQRLGNP